MGKDLLFLFFLMNEMAKPIWGHHHAKSFKALLSVKVTNNLQEWVKFNRPDHQGQFQDLAYTVSKKFSKLRFCLSINDAHLTEAPRTKNVYVYLIDVYCNHTDWTGSNKILLRKEFTDNVLTSSVSTFVNSSDFEVRSRWTNLVWMREVQ